MNLKDRHVTEFFQKKYLLRDIHLAIPQGHMVLLLGGSGAGKTTFLNAVNGYEKADATVLLNGNNMYTQYKKMQYEVGFVPQQEMIRTKDTVEKTLLDAAQLRRFGFFSGNFCVCSYIRMTRENILQNWLHLVLFIGVFALLSTVTLEFIDKDKR